MIAALRRVRADPFARSIGLVTVAALVVRLVYVLGFRRDLTVAGDAYFYHYGANLLVHGKGFIAPLQYMALHTRVEAADHPPLYILFLAVPSAFGLGTTLVHMLWSACLGTATVVVTGLVGRRVAGARAGVLAAAIVALSPNLWVYEGTVLSETMAIFVATLALLFAYRALDSPTTKRFVAFGAICGLAMLARSELALLVPALVWPVALVAGGSWRRRAGRAAVATLAAAIVVSPWVGYNLSRFRHPVYLSSQLEVTLAGANCDDTYYGANIGLFTNACLARFPQASTQEESVRARALGEGARDYVDAHLGRVPVVAAARVARVTGVYRVGQQMDLDVFLEGRERPVAVAALVVGYLTELLAIAGALVVRRRRERPVFPLVVLPATVLVTVALTYGNDRFRASAETALAILAAVALDAFWNRVRRPADERGLARTTG